MRGRKGMSPIVATVLLIAFAVALGVVVMKLGHDFTGAAPTCQIDDLKDVYFTENDLCSLNGNFYRMITKEDGIKYPCLQKKMDPVTWPRTCDASKPG